MKASQYARGRGNYQAYAFKNSTQSIPFYADWMEGVRGNTATEDMPVIEIQTKDDTGLACVYSRGFLVAMTPACYTHYLLFGQEEMRKLLAEGVERMIVSDRYISTDEFLKMDQPIGTPVPPMDMLDVDLPAVKPGYMKLHDYGDVSAALLADVWKAMFDRFMRGGSGCLIPVGCIVTPKDKTGDIWHYSMALARSVQEYLPRPVRNIFSMTVGAEWSHYNAQPGSAWYVCRDENLRGDQQEGLYDFVRGVFNRRCGADELELGRALLEKKPMRFYEHVCRTDAEYATGESRLCYDMGFANNLYMLQRLLDNPAVDAGTKISGALNAWRNLDNDLYEYERRGWLSGKQHCYALLPVIREISVLLKDSDVELTRNQCRQLISTLFDQDMPGPEWAEIREVFRAALIGRSMLKNGKESILQVLTSSDDFFQFSMWKRADRYPELIGKWLQEQRVQNFLSEEEKAGLVKLLKDEVANKEGLKAQVNGFCAQSLRCKPSKRRLAETVNLLVDAGVPASAGGEAMTEQISAALCRNFEAVVLPDEVGKLIRSYIGLDGGKPDVPKVLFDHLKVLLANGAERNVFGYFCSLAAAYPRSSKDINDLKEAFGKWMDARWGEEQYTREEIGLSRKLLDVYPGAAFDEVLVLPAVHRIRSSRERGEIVYLRTMLTGWNISLGKLGIGGDVAEYLERVYGTGDIHEDDLQAVLAFRTELQKENNQSMDDALYAHLLMRLENCAAWKDSVQPLMILNNVLTLKTEHIGTLFGYMKRCQSEEGYASEQLIRNVCAVLNRTQCGCETMWLDYACSGLETGMSEKGIRQAQFLRDHGVIRANVGELTNAVIGFVESRPRGGQLPAEKAMIEYLGQPNDRVQWLTRAAVCLGGSFAASQARQTKDYMMQFMFLEPEKLEFTFADRVEAADAWKAVRSEYVSHEFERIVIDRLSFNRMSAADALALWQNAGQPWMRGAAPEQKNGAWKALNGYLTGEAHRKLAAKAAELVGAELSIDGLRKVYDAAAAGQDWYEAEIATCLRNKFDEEWMDSLTGDLETVSEAAQLQALNGRMSIAGSSSQAKRTVDFVCAFCDELKAAKASGFADAGEKQLGSWLNTVSSIDKNGEAGWMRVALRLARAEAGKENGHWTTRLFGRLIKDAKTVRIDWDGYFDGLVQQCETEKTWEEQKRDPWHDDSCIVQLLMWQAARLEQAELSGTMLADDFRGYLKSDGMQAVMAKIRGAGKEAKVYSESAGYRTIFGGTK